MISLGCRHTDDGKLLHKHYLTVQTAHTHAHTHLLTHVLKKSGSDPTLRGRSSLRSPLLFVHMEVKPSSGVRSFSHAGINVLPPSRLRAHLRNKAGVTARIFVVLRGRAAEELVKSLHLRGGQSQGFLHHMKSPVM